MYLARIGRFVIGAILSVAVLTGCGKFYWGKANASQEDFDRDNRECARQASPTPAAADIGIVYERQYRQCLTAHGWARGQHINPPPGWYRGIE